MDQVSTSTLIIILVIMILVSAWFAGSETGMMTLNRYKLRHNARNGDRAAKRVEKLLSKPDRLISLVLIGNNLVNILASSLATIVGIRLYGNTGVAIATGILTFVVLVFAEVLPKTIAALYPEKVAYPSSFLLALADHYDAHRLVAELHHPCSDAAGRYSYQWCRQLCAE